MNLGDIEVPRRGRRERETAGGTDPLHAVTKTPLVAGASNYWRIKPRRDGIVAIKHPREAFRRGGSPPRQRSASAKASGGTHPPRAARLRHQGRRLRPSAGC